MIMAQYRPHSLIEHIGSGVPWDLDRSFTGGVGILTPYKARGSSEWYLGTADSVQQNFLFIKRGAPDNLLVLSGDHIYKMNYRGMIERHTETQADLTLATIRVPMDEASALRHPGDGRRQPGDLVCRKAGSAAFQPGKYGRVSVQHQSTGSRRLWEDHLRREFCARFRQRHPAAAWWPRDCACMLIRSTVIGWMSGRWLPTGRRTWTCW